MTTPDLFVPPPINVAGLSYKFGKEPGVVIRINDTASFIASADIFEAKQYAAWLLVPGNITQPADPPSAEEIATAAAMITRQTTLTRITTDFPTSWANFETMITTAITLKNKTNAAWVANDSRDGVKLLLNVAMFCAAKLLVLIIERQDRR